MTEAEYLAFEEQATDKHEYVDGWVYALYGTGQAGATRRHGPGRRLLLPRRAGGLRRRLAGRPVRRSAAAAGRNHQPAHRARRPLDQTGRLEKPPVNRPDKLARIVHGAFFYDRLVHLGDVHPVDDERPAFAA
jgi:hypothetical protein